MLSSLLAVNPPPNKIYKIIQLHYCNTKPHPRAFLCLYLHATTLVSTGPGGIATLTTMGVSRIAYASRRKANQVARFAREVPGKNAETQPAYAAVQAMSPETLSDETAGRGGGGALQPLQMSDEMRRALAEVVAEEAAPVQPSADPQSYQKQVDSIRKKRYNHGAPTALDWRVLSWDMIVMVLGAETVNSTLEPTAKQAGGYKVHNTVDACVRFAGFVECEEVHPVTAALQVRGFDERANRGKGLRGFDDVGSLCTAAAFARLQKMIAESPSRQASMLLLESARVLWFYDSRQADRHDKAGRVRSVFLYVSILSRLGQIDVLRALTLRSRGWRQVLDAIQAGGLVQAYLAVIGDVAAAEDEAEKYVATIAECKNQAVRRLVALRALFVHYITSGCKEQAAKGWALLETCAIPQDQFLYGSQAVWLSLLEMVGDLGVGLNHARRIIKTVIPYLADNPSQWCEELLGIVIEKHVGVHDGTRKAYAMLKQGNNAGMPLYEGVPAAEMPPPRCGMRALMKVACENREAPERVQALWEFMLAQECRPSYEEMHSLLLSCARGSVENPAHFKVYRNILTWVHHTPELVVADQTLIQALAAAAPAGVDETLDAFAATTSLLGYVSQDAVTALMDKLLDGSRPVMAFVELCHHIPSAIYEYPYMARRITMRLGSHEVVGAVLHSFETKNIPLNFLEEPLKDAHSLWSGGSYTVVSNKKGNAVMVPEESLDKSATLAYTTQLEATDAWLLTPYGMYDLHPAHLGIPDGAGKLHLVHWSTLVFADDVLSALAQGADGEYTAVPCRHLHHAMATLRGMEDEHDVASDLWEESEVICRLEPEGKLQEAFEGVKASLRAVKAQGTAVRKAVEEHAVLLPYAEEVSLVADAETRVRLHDGRAPTDAAFAATAAALAAQGFEVVCVVECADARAVVASAVAGSGAAVVAPPVSLEDGGEEHEEGFSTTSAWRVAEERTRRATALRSFLPSGLDRRRRAPDHDQRKKGRRLMFKGLGERQVMFHFCRDQPVSALGDALPWKQA